MLRVKCSVGVRDEFFSSRIDVSRMGELLSVFLGDVEMFSLDDVETVSVSNAEMLLLNNAVTVALCDIEMFAVGDDGEISCDIETLEVAVDGEISWDAVSISDPVAWGLGVGGNFVTSGLIDLVGEGAWLGVWGNRVTRGEMDSVPVSSIADTEVVSSSETLKVADEATEPDFVVDKAPVTEFDDVAESAKVSSSVREPVTVGSAGKSTAGGQELLPYTNRQRGCDPTLHWQVHFPEI
jgi:hypothetical protein